MSEAGEAPSRGLTGQQLQQKILESLKGRNVTLYQVLNVESDADIVAVKRAYRQLARELHPDRNTTEEAQDKFQNVQCAYDVLKDSSSRAIYDQLGYEGLLAADGLHPTNRGWLSRHPILRAINYFFFIITLGYFCYGFCFCCNCCCGHCKGCMTKIIGERNMRLYEQAQLEAEVVEVVEETVRRESRMSAAASRKASGVDGQLPPVQAPLGRSPLANNQSASTPTSPVPVEPVTSLTPSATQPVAAVANTATATETDTTRTATVEGATAVATSTASTTNTTDTITVPVSASTSTAIPIATAVRVETVFDLTPTATPRTSIDVTASSSSFTTAAPTTTATATAMPAPHEMATVVEIGSGSAATDGQDLNNTLDSQTHDEPRRTLQEEPHVAVV